MTLQRVLGGDVGLQIGVRVATLPVMASTLRTAGWAGVTVPAVDGLSMSWLIPKAAPIPTATIAAPTVNLPNRLERA